MYKVLTIVYFRKISDIMARDKFGRSYEDKSTITWSEAWMAEYDGYSDSFGSWARRHDT